MKEHLIRYLTTASLISYLGVSKNFFYVHVKKDPTFPKALTLTASKSVYDRLQVDKWIEQNQKQLQTNQQGERR